ncbi:NUDIX domain-containing protein [Streptomyces huiliensis]|uniref:NUDIX domain-containing protein n=1 Tax=Streptomyces huiliensis TaxID=2876027 RepID=UPI001CBDFF0C|nr:NUDIX domain-containing protein [Streptomyces huiliensis]MBZ4321294.1 NUDIX domain-containing protein [Streptomyces huiliensis]
MPFESRTGPCPCTVDVMVLLHREDGRVLLVRRDGPLVPPGGVLRYGEPVTARALREVRRQTGVGVDPDDLEFCHLVHRRTTGGQGRLAVVFTAQRWVGRLRSREDSGRAAMVWADPARPPADRTAHTAALLDAFNAGALLSTDDWATRAGGAA